MNHLVNYSQIKTNLIRTAKLGLISLIDQRQLEDLAYEFFGVKDEEGNFVRDEKGSIKYTCPYSGKIIENYDDIVIEHIMPVASKGGTVLINCIHASKEANAKKSSNNLISWWKNSEYWDKNAPERLEKLGMYMLKAYDIVFEEYEVEYVLESYEDVVYDESNEANSINENKDIEEQNEKDKKDI